LKILLEHLLVEVKTRAQQIEDMRSTTNKKDSKIKTKTLKNEDAKTRIAS